jgi:hypothetical protein
MNAFVRRASVFPEFIDEKINVSLDNNSFLNIFRMDLLVAGIEPATDCLECNCSTDELYKFLAEIILYSLQVSVFATMAYYAIVERGAGIEPAMFLFAETNLVLEARPEGLTN